ncbi:MAG: low molecular weight protein arginine phosphatase [Candidatus Promineifilaceae bacterium]
MSKRQRVNILIVCTANICRSPVVEAILQQKLAAAGRKGWLVHSMGTWASAGQAASALSVQLMAEQGIDISRHRSRQVTPEALAAAELILTMEAGHAEALRVEFPAQADKVYLLSQMSGQNHNVADPYGRRRPAYEHMVREVESLIEDGLDEIIRLTQENRGARQTTRLKLG